MERKKIGSRVKKGEYGYLVAQRIKVIIRTVFMFALSLGIFGIGLWLNGGDKKSIWTIAAVVGLLPASRSAVSMIMFLKARGCSDEAHQRLQKQEEGLTYLYDLFFTSYQKNYQVSHMVVKDSIICGFSEDAACDEKACARHIESMLKQSGYKNITVKIDTNLQKYCESLDNLKSLEGIKNEDAEKKLQDILSCLLSITL